MALEIATQLELFSLPSVSGTLSPLGDTGDSACLPFGASVAPAGRPGGGSAATAGESGEDTLTREIATLHDLLAEVYGTTDLELAQRVTAYCKGADTLARLLRAQHGLAPTDPAGGLAALLERLDEGGSAGY